MSHLKDCICGKKVSSKHLRRHQKSCKEFTVFEKTKDLATTNQQIKQHLDHQDNKITKLELEILQKEEIIRKQQEIIEKQQEIIQKLEEEHLNSGYNYIIQTRESQRMKENVYKIGRTKCIQKRFKQYPKGSKLIYSRKSSDDKISECLLKRNFANIFRQRKDYGSEYFEGEIQNMKIEFDNILDNFV
jgi:hypothetical protein